MTGGGDDDRARVQRSALRVGLLVGAASALIVTLGVAILVTVLVATARPEGHHDGAPREPDGDRFVVDLDHVLPWVVVLGALGVLLLAAVAWWASRWAVRPLADALRLQRSFVADASHELRTPLTALTGRIQILERRRRRDEPLDDTIRELRHDAAVLDDVLTDMLLIAEGDAAGADAAPPADVERCARAAVQTIAPLATAAAVTTTLDIEGAPRARIPAATLTRLCVALLDNAVQHAPGGTEVALQARHVDGVVQIRVSDRGHGVAAEDAERIFERFARGGEVGRRRGFGLGLALVREAATRYGGSVRIEHTSPQGSTFLLTIPVAR